MKSNTDMLSMAMKMAADAKVKAAPKAKVAPKVDREAEAALRVIKELKGVLGKHISPKAFMVRGTAATSPARNKKEMGAGMALAVSAARRQGGTMDFSRRIKMLMDS